MVLLVAELQKARLSVCSESRDLYRFVLLSVEKSLQASPALWLAAHRTYRLRPSASSWDIQDRISTHATSAGSAGLPVGDGTEQVISPETGFT